MHQVETVTEQVHRQIKPANCGAAIVLIVVAGSGAKAADWPTYLHDNRRSGITSEHLAPPLYEQWRYTPQHAPRPSWGEPARADMWHRMPIDYEQEGRLNPSVTYDRAFHVAAVGNAVYFGSSADDQVRCLDASTGKVRWSFFADAPVRLCPTLCKGKVYFGSDDGRVYCVSATDGELAWKRRVIDDPRLIPGNGRLVSTSPIRTGVVVQDGVVYAIAGLFPNQGVFVCALEAANGSIAWKRDTGVPAQGYLVASSTRLYTPTGRTTPAAFDLKEGALLGSVKVSRGEGGTYMLLAGDQLIHGPGEARRLVVAGADRADRIASFDGLRMIAGEKISFVQTDSELVALDRPRYVEAVRTRTALAERQRELAKRLKKLGRRRRAGGEESQQLKAQLAEAAGKLQQAEKAASSCDVWRQPCPHRYALILAGDVLFAGGDGEVAAYATADGKRLWQAKVTGRAYGLAVANGHLYVSTNKGTIHCFAAAATTRPRIVRAGGGADFSPDARRAKAYAETADRIAEQARLKRGYCLVLGCGEGHLAREIAQRTEMHVVGVEPERGKVAAARKMLAEAGLYGTRVTIHCGELGKLPYGDYTFNLIVQDPTLAKCPTPADEVFRLLTPCRGVACIGPDGPGLDEWIGKASSRCWKRMDSSNAWAICRRGPLPGSGDWTHMYADPANTAASAERRITGPVQVQWFGPPGPREIVDRHHRNVPPLVRDGRVFIPGDNRVIAVDAYNGAELWRLDLPNSRRLGAPFDAHSMVIAKDCVYWAVGDECLRLDPETGEQKRALAAPQRIKGQKRHWGYVGLVEDSLFGSGRKPDATYTTISRNADAYQWGDYKRMVTSDYFFCMDRHTGKVRWTYRSGVIIHPSIAIGGGRVYFVASLGKKAANDADGQINMMDLTEDGVEMVALDAKTGKRVWKQTPDFSEITQVLYLCYAEETLLAYGARNQDRSIWHNAIAFDARTGKEKWRQTNNTGWGRGGGHGEQVRHPILLDGIVYAERYAYELSTGRPVPNWRFNYGRSGCGNVTASATCLFYRDRNPTMLNLASRRETRLSRVNRPGCWVNIIPACGLVVVPEGSSGCTCPFPIQTSMAFVPKTGAGG